MGYRALTVRRLADMAGLDVEEVLIRAWDAGFEDIENPDKPLPASIAGRIRDVAGLPSARDITRPAYWTRVLDIDEVQLRQLLADAGLHWKASAKVFPKGAVRVLKQYARGTVLLETPPTLPEKVIPEIVHLPEPEVEWKTVGRVPRETFISAEQVNAVHMALVADFARDDDPIVPAGVRDESLLESAVYRQHTESGNHVKYPTAEMVAAALLHSLVHNHAFFNGNKRTALVSMLVSLDSNGLILTSSEEQLFRLVLRLAQHQVVPASSSQLADREVLWIAAWIVENSRPIEKGEKPIQWRRLKRILSDFGCTWSFARVGNRLNIQRSVEGSGRWTRRARLLSVQVKYTDDGRDAQRYTVHEIRRGLELDEEHGVDSASFYGVAEHAIDEFIVRYRKLLKRLSKL